MKILIVEDDENISKMITCALSIVGYESEACFDGAQAVTRAESLLPDLILLDVMLPGMDGFVVMERIRHLGIPVIFLTAMQEVTDKVRGLKLGADDYIVKPFEAVELLARIEVVLRRSKKSACILTFGEITVNIDEHTARSGETLVALTPKEFDVLVFFLRNINIALTRERLLSAVWGYEFAGESRTVDIHVQQVRRKMKLKNRLVTIPKLGYRLESGR
ncbi:MAG: response regulator transcription factor [Oscillospiraceae bacterium]